MAKYFLKLTILLLFAVGSSVQAFEIDSFYKRKQELKDSTEILNQEINSRIETAVSKTKSCNLEELYTNARNQISADSAGFGVIGGMESWAEKSDKLDKIQPPPQSQSIYYGTSFESITSMGFWLSLYKETLDGIKSGFSKARSSVQKLTGTQKDPLVERQVPSELKVIATSMLKGPGVGGPPPGGAYGGGPGGGPGGAGGGAGNLEPVISLAGSRVGVDKLGHFFDQGAEYFRAAYTIDGGTATLKPDGIRQALAVGKSQEEGMFGYKGTGIKSYGDMSANYGGLRFWHQLGASSDPLVRCQNGKYKVVKKFDFKNFVTDAWDEGINCSEYKSQEMQNKVNENLKALKMTCPAEIQRCQKIASQYEAKVFNEIIGPACQAQIQAKPRLATSSLKINGVVFSEPQIEGGVQ